MSDLIKQYELKGYKLNIYRDEEPFSPREDDNQTTMVCFHSRYSLGDSHDITDVEEANKVENHKDNISLPLYLYDHSGITMRTSPFSCKWDSGKVGFIYISRKDARKMLGCKKLTKKRVETVIDILESEVEVYDNYLCGDVYTYEIIDKDGEIIDSCCGFYGDNFKINGVFDNAILSDVDGEWKEVS